MNRSNPLDRAFLLLDIVAAERRAVSLGDIVTHSGLPLSSAHRLASNLVEAGMLSLDVRTKMYGPGPRLRRLGFMVSGTGNLEALIDPPLDLLSRETEETSFFVLASGDGGRLLRYRVPEVGARAFIHPGFAFPLHASAAGKVIAAFGLADMGQELAQASFERYQPKTVTDRRQIAAMLKAVQAQGYATNNGELDRDVFSAAAPVFTGDTIIGAIGFVGPTDRICRDGGAPLKAFVAVLQEEANRLSTLMTVTDTPVAPAPGARPGRRQPAPDGSKVRRKADPRA